MWFSSGRCQSEARLNGKTAIITGANCGIGKYTAFDFVKRGARVIMACRDLKKAGEAAAEIRSEVEGLEKVGEIVVVQLDLSSLQSIRECAGHILKTEKMVHILVNNAGVCYCPKGYTRDGFELHIGINHLGHFLFTCLLLPRIIRSAPARIVTVSSYKGNVAQGIYLDDLHWEKRPYNPFEAYSESKLANVLFSTELSRRLEGKGVTTYAVHPGVVATDAGRYADMSFFPGARWLFENVLVYIIKTPEQGAQTTIHCAVCEDAEKETGLFYRECRRCRPHRLAYDHELSSELWNRSAKLVGLGDWDPFTAQDKI